MQKEAKSEWHTPGRAQLQCERRTVQLHHVTGVALAAEEGEQQPPSSHLRKSVPSVQHDGQHNLISMQN